MMAALLLLTACSGSGGASPVEDAARAQMAADGFADAAITSTV